MSLLAIFPTNVDPVRAANDLGDILVEACLPHCKLAISTIIAHAENRARKVEADQKHFDMEMEHPIVQWAFEDMNHLWWLIKYYDAAREVFTAIPGRSEDVAVEHADECHRIARWWGEQGFATPHYKDELWTGIIADIPFQAPSGLRYGGNPVAIAQRWLSLGPQRTLQSWWNVKEVPDWWIDIRLSIDFHPQGDRHGVEVWEENGELRVDLEPVRAVRAALKGIPETVKATRGDELSEDKRAGQAVADIRKRLREIWHLLVHANYPALALKHEAGTIQDLMLALEDLTGAKMDRGLTYWLDRMGWLVTRT